MINSFLRKKFQNKAEIFYEDINLFHQIQKKIINQFVIRGQATLFGREHQFRSIRSIKDFQQKVPIRFYEDFTEYIDMMREGKENILWDKPIHWFAKSSGTTNDRSKYIPVSDEALKKNHIKAGKDLFSIYTRLNSDSNIFSLKSKSLVLGGSQKIIKNKRNKKIYEGDISAVILKNLPSWTKLFRTPKNSITLMPDYEKKIELMAEVVKEKNITNISGVPSWAWVLIQKVLKEKNAQCIKEVWPNIELFVHGGVNFEPYQTLFKSVMPSKNFYYMEVYNASEGFFAFQDSFNNKDLQILINHGIFYEFVPLKQLYDKNPQALTLHKVELNKPYAMIITTNSGLWRYCIGDTVIFKSIYPHKIRILGRTKLFINAFGEELMISNAETALHKVCDKQEVIVSDFTAGPIYLSDNTKGGHQWLIEFITPPKNLVGFAKELDNEICQINSDYEAKRTGDLAMKNLQIISIPKGTFYKWMKTRNKLGGQNKVPRLSNDRKIIDSILSIIERE